MASSYAVGPGGWVERRWQREIGTSTTRNEATRHTTHWPNGSFGQRYSDVFRNSARRSHLKKKQIEIRNRKSTWLEKQLFTYVFFICDINCDQKNRPFFFKSEMQKTTTNVTTTNSPQPRCHKSLPASSLHWWRWAPSTKLQSCPPDARPKCSVGTWFLQTDIFLKKMEGNLGKEKKNGKFFKMKKWNSGRLIWRVFFQEASTEWFKIFLLHKLVCFQRTDVETPHPRNIHKSTKKIASQK